MLSKIKKMSKSRRIKLFEILLREFKSELNYAGMSESERRIWAPKYLGGNKS